jgi:hypothetical protein
MKLLIMQSSPDSLYLLPLKGKGKGKGKGKVVPVLNKAPRHEDVLGNGGIALRILDIGTRWRGWSA